MASLAVLPDWPQASIGQQLEYPSHTELGPPVTIAGGSLVGFVVGAVLFFYLIWEWWQSIGKSDRRFQWTAAMTRLVTNLIAVRTATTNYVVMLPGLCLMYSVWADRWGKRGNLLIAATLAGLLIGLWGLFFATVEGNVESRAMYHPLPVLMLVGLWWTRWWAVREIHP